MNDKEILKKLFKIASNQQKIITKLAQDLNSNSNITEEVNIAIQNLKLKGATCLGATKTATNIQATINVVGESMDNRNKIINPLKNVLSESYGIPPQNINIILTWG